MANSTEIANTSTQQVTTSLITHGVIFSIFVTSFILLRLKFKRIYQPKSSFNLINDEKKPTPLPSGLWQWIIPLLKKSDNFIIRQAGLDGYFFIRYLFLISSISLCGMLLLFPILLPINAVNGNGSDGLDQFSFANVSGHHKYYAHAILSVFFYLGVVYVIYRELTYFTSMRQAVLSSPRYGQKLSSRVVLFQTVPTQYLDEIEFSKLFDDVKKVWIARSSGNIAGKVKERDQLAMKLEAAENKLLKLAIKNKLKEELKLIKERKKNGEFDIVEPKESTIGELTLEDINKYVPDKKRPKHRLKFLFGKKVDTINYALEQLPILNKEVYDLQTNHKDSKPMNSIFVEFGSQYSAQLAYQSTAHHTALHLSPKMIGLEPQDIIWINMRMFWWERLARFFGANAAVIALLIFWSIPVAFVGLISNITYLTNKLPWLRFIYHLPDQLLGILTSLAPTVALALLMMVLPIFIRNMAKLAGAPSYQAVEYFTQQAYFGFQVIQVFLVTTIASSASSVVTQIIEEPTSALKLLSDNLPKASNFYISYIILQGFSVSSGALLQIVTLIVYYLLGSLLDGTPRKKYSRFVNLSSLQWGTVFPVFTNLAVIILTYSIISPFILLFATVAFFFLYVAYLYNLTYTYAESPDSRGIHYPRALFQTFVGVYLGELCLLALFAVSKAWGPLIIEAILVGITVFVHVNLNLAFDKLLLVVPVDTMKPLDGKSTTSSYRKPTFFGEEQTHYTTNNSSTENYYESSLKNKRDSYLNSSIIRDSLSPNDGAVELEDLNRLSLDHQRHGATVPLLADGDHTVIPPAPFWKRFFQPHIYASYKGVKTRIPDIYNFTDPNDITEPTLIENSYNYPAVSAKCPYLWIPRDKYGWSTAEIEKFRGIIEISDEGSFWNEKGKIEWEGNPPSYDEVVDKNDETSPFQDESK
ncbi:hypothetical protein WICMUC_001221 [Wickerhamomyces mucosus]|uniref:DUF221-domain-containing protein n=1 Tax=Wickerhamomyces mucosus TaxID=1378264 RepID=A0A9P8THY5_9ASCO|nr:hypothetical protein WICMUC_001221 [Wickerhamomyces mucosus]